MSAHRQKEDASDLLRRLGSRAILPRLCRTLSHARKDIGGNVAIMFATMAVPMIAAVGCAVDYSFALMVKAKLQTAADAATLAAVSINSPAVAVAKSMNGDGAIAGGDSFLASFFKTNLPRNGFSELSTARSVLKSGSAITANIAFAAAVPTTFLGILGFPTLGVSGSSSANSNVGSSAYTAIYLMLDVSGSMGLPASSSDQTRFLSLNPDMKDKYPKGCAFACHFTVTKACTNVNGTVGYCQGYTVAQSNGIQLRIDAASDAVKSLLTKAQQSTSISNQFAIGLYPFIQYLQEYQTLSTNLTDVATSASQITNLLDTGYGGSALGSGGTHFENALPKMNEIIRTVGDGSSAASRTPFVFLITDGTQDYQTYYYNKGFWAGSNTATTLDPTLCDSLKQRGIKVGVLYIPYVTIQYPVDAEDFAANSNIPNIPGPLRACSSPGIFFTANSASDIATALQQMFATAVSTPRLTQ